MQKLLHKLIISVFLADFSTQWYKMESLLTKHKRDLTELAILLMFTDQLVGIEDSLIVRHVMWKFEK